MLFHSTPVISANGHGWIPALFPQRPIVLCHQKATMYHPFTEAVALTLVDIPFMFLTLIMYSVILYKSVSCTLS